MKDFIIEYHPKDKEKIEYKIKVSRNSYKWYEIYNNDALTLSYIITIQRTPSLKKKYNAYIEWENILCKTDKRKTIENWNWLWGWLWYKTKEEWEKVIYSYQTYGQIKRDFFL